MKFKTTQKAIKANYKNIICIGYCNLQQLLSGKEPIAYTTRKEGWAADIYEINPTTVIVTGYAPFGNIRPEYDIIEKYEHKANVIKCSSIINWEEKRARLNILVTEFVNRITE